MSASFNVPKAITGMLPLVDTYRQKSSSQHLEEQDTLLAETSSSEKLGPRTKQAVSTTKFVAIVLSCCTILFGLFAWLAYRRAHKRTEHEFAKVVHQLWQQLLDGGCSWMYVRHSRSPMDATRMLQCNLIQRICFQGPKTYVLPMAKSYRATF